MFHGRGPDKGRLRNNNSLSAQRGLKGDLGLAEDRPMTKLSFLALLKSSDQLEGSFIRSNLFTKHLFMTDPLAVEMKMTHPCLQEGGRR